MKLLICLFAVCSVALATTREEYCRTCPGQHTMCIYHGVSRACGQTGASGVSNHEKAFIVDLHNRLRNKVASGQERQGMPGPQPSASNMKAMTWDDGLAEVAQRWTDQCKFDHDVCRKDPRFPEVDNGIGQNAAYDTSCENRADWNMVVNMWYNEVSQFSRYNVNSYRFQRSIGHYSQVVWADTYKVGCGFRTSRTFQGCRRYYFCNYGPTGNFRGSRVYQTGQPRSACPRTTHNSSYPALCSGAWEELPQRQRESSGSYLGEPVNSPYGAPLKIKNNKYLGFQQLKSLIPQDYRFTYQDFCDNLFHD